MLGPLGLITCILIAYRSTLGVCMCARAGLCVLNAKFKNSVSVYYVVRCSESEGLTYTDKQLRAFGLRDPITRINTKLIMVDMRGPNARINTELIMVDLRGPNARINYTSRGGCEQGCTPGGGGGCRAAAFPDHLNLKIKKQSL
jgi:hypothetical protein